MRVSDLHAAVDVICDSWARARAVMVITGAWPTSTNRGGSGSSGNDHADPVGNALIAAANALEWEARLRDAALKFVEYRPVDPDLLRRDWHALFDRHPTGWSLDAIREVWWLADSALRWFTPLPPVKAGDLVDGLVAGDGRRLASDVELCALCAGVLIAGRRRFVPDSEGGGAWYCTSPCWYTTTTVRGIHPRQVAS